MNKATLEAEIAELVKPVSMTEVVKRLERDDVQFQTGEYTTLVDLESQSISEQLRQRATMMRRRADEFDIIADDILRATNSLMRDAKGFEESHKNALEILRAHAHIQPTRT